MSVSKPRARSVPALPDVPARSLALIRSSIVRNCRTFADDPGASAIAMDLMLTLRRTGTAFQTLAEAYTRAYDLSPAKVTIVMSLAANEGHTLAQAEIGRQLSVSLGNLTALLAALEASGLVRRRPDPADGRVTNVSLTAKGLALVKRFAPVHYRTVAAALDGLTRDEQLALIALLDKMREQLTVTKTQPVTSPRKKAAS